jgi:phosphoglycolate phosphatase-like HAD superfamily hydrolase
MIRFLIWDADGTLFDTYPSITKAIGLALSDLGVAASTSRISRLARHSLRRCIAVLADEVGVDRGELSDRFSHHYALMPPRMQAPFPGALRVCTYVRRHGGSNFIFTHRRRESLEALLSAHELTDYFADYLAGDDGYPRKPDPAALEAIIQKHRLDRDEVLAIGDRDIDILTGNAAKVWTCAFRFTSAKITADYVISDFVELYRLLKRRFKNSREVGDG